MRLESKFRDIFKYVMALSFMLLCICCLPDADCTWEQLQEPHYRHTGSSKRGELDCVFVKPYALGDILNLLLP